MTGHATFAERLRQRALASAEALAYAFLDDDDELRRITYAQLDRQARALAAGLQRRRLAGAPVLLLLPPGLEYIGAFFGVLYAGAVPVPTYPPPPGRHERGLARLHLVAADAAAHAVITTESLRPRVQAAMAALSPAPAVLVAPADGVDPDEWREAEARADDLAFIQYSSGSTGAPRGVCLSHANLLANAEHIRHAFGHGPQSRGVIWLPPYHDMGLIGGILQPLHVGFPVLLMSPLAFLQRPARWLRAISAFHATTSGGPNFAYELCLRRVTETDKESLDLSSWDVAFTGAEPVRAATLERFAAAFAGCGFRRRAFHPCYGLAEATLMVSGGEKGGEPVVQRVRRDRLERHEVSPASESSAFERVVACGRSVPGVDVRIVDHETGALVEAGRVGEIWVRGPIVASGYWRRPEETQATFAARLSGDSGGPFLRTGDLGFETDGLIFVTGRLKDLILIRGRNLYPQDVEAMAETSHPLLRAGGGAAFGIDHDGEERLVVVHEVDRRFKPEAHDDVVEALRAAVAETFDVSVWVAVLIRPGTLPRTTSGKVQRRACREAFRAGTLATWEPAGASIGGADLEDMR